MQYPIRTLLALVMFCSAAFVSVLSTHEAAAAQVVLDSALSNMPVKEITVFKDGHAFMLHEGVLPVDEHGNVHLDYLPTPIIGTFWPYSAARNVELTGVVAAKQSVEFKRTALSIRDLLEANVGAKILTNVTDRSYAATIVDIPRRSSDELTRASPCGSQPSPEQTGETIVLKTAEGFKVIGIDTIHDVTFLEQPETTIAREELRNVLSLKLAWPNGRVSQSARVGMAYLQRGIRWIPSYKIEIDGQGKAVLQLQATLLNEMIDFENATVNLVIGVPNFYFKETTDPIALNQTVSQLSPYFQTNSRTAYALSNSMRTQVARGTEVQRVRVASPTDNFDFDVDDGGKREDLFIFTVEDVSLNKGERMVVPITEFPLEYTDVYSLEVAFAPPPEVRRNFNSQQQAELARLFHAPKVMHKIRLRNTSKYPLTTAPAVIQQEGRLLGQGMMTYAPSGGRVDLPITTAVDVNVKRRDNEINRKANAGSWGGHSYDRIDLEGAITLTNYRTKPVDLEIVRDVLGNATEVRDGHFEKVNVHEETWRLGHGHPSWWHWYSWPSWWHHLNGVSRIRWKTTLQPRKNIDLKYKWHYFWRG